VGKGRRGKAGEPAAAGRGGSGRGRARPKQEAAEPKPAAPADQPASPAAAEQPPASQAAAAAAGTVSPPPSQPPSARKARPASRGPSAEAQEALPQHPDPAVQGGLSLVAAAVRLALLLGPSKGQLWRLPRLLSILKSWC
jgi:hypothetical protein